MKIYIFIIAFLFLFYNGVAEAKPSLKSTKWPPENYLVYYGNWNSEKVLQAQNFNLVILHPGKDLTNITSELIDTLKKGKDQLYGTDDDIIVIAYVSIGEDESVPRGPKDPNIAETGPVYFTPQKGIIKSGKNYPSRYTDEISYIFNKEGFINWLPSGSPEIKKGHDGLPDENGKWQSFFVYSGDPEWQEYILNKMKTLSNDYKVDGFFLDTLDAASPWGNYGWMEEDMALLINKIRNNFTDKYIIVNRGLFLFEKYEDLIRPDIDGLMFESFISEWDWYRGIGIQHPFLKSNYDILKQYVLPNAVKPDGFHLFFLNYLNPEQSDFYNIIYDQMNLLKNISYSSYISTPDLQKINPLNKSYFPETTDFTMAEIKEFNLEEKDPGKYTISIKLSNCNDPERDIGKNLFFDIRYTDKEISKEEIPLLPRVNINYQNFKKNGDIFLYNSFGLDKGKTYYFFIKLLGRNPSLQSSYIKTTINTKNGDYPGIINNISGEGREKSVYLTWDESYECTVYKIYMGTEINNITYYKTVNSNYSLVEGLENNKAYYFTIGPVSKTGEEGCLSYPVISYPQDCTPPPSPKNIMVKYENNKVNISWDMVEEEDIKGYCLYCFQSDEGIRLPMLLDKTQYSITLEKLKEGKIYTIFITSIDLNNNQSQTGEKKILLLKP